MKRLRKNMGTTDRFLRFVIALVIGYSYFDGVIHGTLAFILFIFAFATLLTGLSGYCPLYPIFGWNTCKRK